MMELHTLGVDSGYTPGGRDHAARNPDRLDLCRTAGPAGRARHVLSSTPMRTSRARRRCSARSTTRRASTRAKRRSSNSPAIRRRRGSSPPSWPALSSPTSRRRRWLHGCRTSSATPMATCGVAKALVDADAAWTAPCQDAHALRIPHRDQPRCSGVICPRIPAGARPPQRLGQPL